MSEEVKHQAPMGEGEGESADLFDYELLRHWVGFVFGGIRRHRVAAVIVFALVLIAGAIVVRLYPKSYRVESKLLANRNQLIRAVGSPHSRVQADDPTRAAEETIFARKNLESLVKQTELIKQWQETRPPILRMKDSIMKLIGGEMSDEDKLDAMVGTLEKKLRVATDSQTVTITVDWPHPELAYQIVEAAQRNFLEARHVTEMTAISEAMSILEVHAAKVQETAEQSLRELEKVRDERRRGLKASTPAKPAAEAGAANSDEAPAISASRREATALQLATEQELAQLKFLIHSKKRAAQDLEDFRSKRLAELNAQLAEERIQYADQHPVIKDTQQRIMSVKQDSPQLVQLRDDVQELIAEYKRKGGGDPDALLEPARRSAQRTASQIQGALSLSELAEDPVVQNAQNALRVANAKHEDLMMRIDAAQIELDTARAAFKYRYSVVRPASIPKRPNKPNVPVLLAATFLGALVMAMLAGATMDLWQGYLVEPWQVERQLGLKVLSEVKMP